MQEKRECNIKYKIMSLISVVTRITREFYTLMSQEQYSPYTHITHSCRHDICVVNSTEQNWCCGFSRGQHQRLRFIDTLRKQFQNSSD